MGVTVVDTLSTKPQRPPGLTLAQAFAWFMPGDPPPAGVVWEWTGCRTQQGYGQIGHQGRNYLAHRVSWELFVGPVPAGAVLRHRNDTPWDVNPNNLELGTYSDNAIDMTKRGRHPRVRLTEADVIDIRRAVESGQSRHSLAKQYGMSRRAIGSVADGSAWAWVQAR